MSDDTLPTPAPRLAAESHATRLVVERAVVLLLVGGLLAGVAAVLAPFVTAILFGGTLAIAAWPLRSWLVGRGLRRGVAASLLLLGAVVLLVLPILAMGPSLSRQITNGLHQAQEFLATSPPAPAWLAGLPLVGKELANGWAEAMEGREQLREMLAPHTGQIGGILLRVVQAVADAVLQLLLSLIVATMFWVSGDALAAALHDVLLRLGGAPAGRALDAVAGAVRGVAYGVVGTAALQGVVMAFGLAIAGVPGAALLGLLTMLLSISQIGAALILLIWGGAAWWLFAGGSTGWAIFMVAWGIMVTTSDNLIRPWLISFGVRMPIAMVILGVFGGFIAFGFLGLFIGPSLLAVAFVLLEAWRARVVAAD